MRYGVQRILPQYAGGNLRWIPHRSGRKPVALVYHRMDGNLDGTDSWFRARGSGITSTHWGIGYPSWYDRRLRRNAQIWQWVPSEFTAYGWASRPTDTPTIYARNTLSDLYIPRADLNWSVIHLEIEGFSTQRWDSNFIPLAVNLENAIRKAHGPLIRLFHTDCSSKPCPGVSTFPYASIGNRGERIGTQLLPDTSLVESVEMSILNKISIPGDVGRLFDCKAGVTLRKGPGTAYPYHFKTTVPVKYRLVGFSPGGWVAAANPNDPTGIFFVPPAH